MGNLINRSNHPVSIKRIGLKIWTLRDEIEWAVSLRLKESQENGVEPDISDLQEFYGRGPNIQTNNDIKESEDAALLDGDNLNLDTSGNPMDEDAADMLAAMQGGDDEDENTEELNDSTEENSTEEQNAEGAEGAEEPDKSAEASDTATETVSEGDDDEAMAMAMAMLADQGLAPEASDTAGTDHKNDSKIITRTPPAAEKVSDGFFLLSDINMDYVLFFSKHSYLQGQTVALEFQIPKKFIITCEILKTEDIDRFSKIISSSKPNYRVQAVLTFNQPGERSNLRDFLKSIEPEIPPPPSKLKKPSSSDDNEDDEFEDLGF